MRETMPEKQFRIVINLLGMLGSDIPAEVATFGSKANEIVRRYGTWEEFLSGKVSVSTVTPPKGEKPKTAEWGYTYEEPKRKKRATPRRAKYGVGIEFIRNRSSDDYDDLIKFMSHIFHKQIEIVKYDVFSMGTYDTRGSASYPLAILYLAQLKSVRPTLIDLCATLFSRGCPQVLYDMCRKREGLKK